MKAFRTIFFWLHLAAGLVAGLSIFIMCFTGAALAFESEIVAWTERDVRRTTPPSPDAPRLSLDELQKKVREFNPEARPTGIVVSRDPAAAVAFTLGREGAIYANPYTGQVKQPTTPNKAHDFLHVMEDWHRVLAMGGDNRAVGKGINGACNLAFCFLALSGLYLWWPRTWSWRGFKAIALFNFGLSGKARDFNWHNSIGLWCAPVLVVLTLTAVPISYRWGGNLIYQLTGEEPPAQAGPAGGGGPGGGSTTPTAEIPRPPEGTRPLGYDALLAAVRNAVPNAEVITFRTGGGFGRGGQRGTGGAGANIGASPQTQAADPARPEGERRPQGESRRNGGDRTAGEQRRGPSPVTVAVKLPRSWPRTATTTLTLNPYTGDVLKSEAYADLSAARRIRSWTRFLHTGQALGWPGQFVAGLACLGGCFLVYTGVALSCRRFFTKKKADPAPAAST